MKIGILTSSRADFGIYLPLLQTLRADEDFDLEIIAFGTHTSKFHGNTLQEIRKAGFEKIQTLTTVVANDDENAVSTSYGLTAMKFADFWSHHRYDLVFCLGDRYEMSAAVQAGIPMEVRFAHLHGGETTLGAIDNIYRHQISLASKMHFTATAEYAQRVMELIGDTEGIYHIGSLSLEGVHDLELPNLNELRQDFKLPEGDFALLTFHPETLAPERNEALAVEMHEGLDRLTKEINLVITMPNADTHGSVFREKLKALKSAHPNEVALVESFGKRNYFAAMKHCRYLIGNTSSGIIEAASLGKHAVNVGDRQNGRVRSENVLDCPFTAKAIYETAMEAKKRGDYKGENRYYKQGAADLMLKVLKKTGYA